MRQNYVIALDFGYPMNPQQKSSITDLASFIMQNYADEPQTVVLAQDFIYDSLCRMKFPKGRLLEVGSGQSSTAGLSSGGSYQMLQMAAEMLRQLETCGTRPLPDDLRPGQTWPPLSATVVAHALHVRRVMRQGKLLGLQLAPPPPEAAEGTLQQRGAMVVSKPTGMVLARGVGVHPLATGGPNLTAHRLLVAVLWAVTFYAVCGAYFRSRARYVRLAITEESRFLTIS